MNITYIFNARFPTERAHGAQVMKMCEALVSCECAVTLVVPKRHSNITMDAFEYYGVTPQPNLRIVYLPTIDFTKFGTHLAFSVLAVSFVISSAFYLWYKRPSIVYTRGESVLFLARLLPAKTGLFWETHIKPHNIKRYRKIFPRINGFITVTKIYADELINEFNIPKEKIITAHDGIDNAFFLTYSKNHARTVLKLKSNEKIVMYFGLLEAWKGVRTLLEASRLLLDEGVRVAIAGGTDKEILELQKEFPEVIFLGFTEYRKLPQLQVAADVLVVPNSAKSITSARYTSPLKVFAHMTSLVPLLVSDLPALREVLNENNSFFFEPDNALSLKDRVLDILRYPDEAKKRALRARLEAKNYTWETRASNIILFIRKYI